MKDVGEPCAGEPHARFDGRGLENGARERHRASPRPNQSRPLLPEWCDAAKTRMRYPSVALASTGSHTTGWPPARLAVRDVRKQGSSRRPKRGALRVPEGTHVTLAHRAARCAGAIGATGPRATISVAATPTVHSLVLCRCIGSIHRQASGKGSACSSWLSPTVSYLAPTGRPRQPQQGCLILTAEEEGAFRRAAWSGQPLHLEGRGPRRAPSPPSPDAVMHACSPSRAVRPRLGSRSAMGASPPG